MRLIFACLILFVFSSAHAQTSVSKDYSLGLVKLETTTDFKEMLKVADFYRGGQVEGVSWKVKVKNIEQGKFLEQIDLFVEAASIEERQFTLVNFLEPKKYSGQKFLVRDNNMWFTKPGLRRPVAISGRQRLSGTASNTDVASVNYYNDYNIAKTEEGEFEGAPCWVLYLEAKNNLVSYAKIKYWISKADNFGVKGEFYGKTDKLIKTAIFEYKNKVSYKSEDRAFLSTVDIIDGINKDDRAILYLTNIEFSSFSSSKFTKNNLQD